MMFRNILRGIKKRPLQLTGIIVLVILSVMAYIAMTGSTSILVANYDNYVIEQKQEHMNYMYSPYFLDMTDEEKKYVIDEGGTELQSAITLAEANGRTQLEAITLYLMMTPNGERILLDIFDERNELLKTEYNLTIEAQFTKNYTTDDKHTFLFTSSREEINLPYVEKGTLPEEENEIAIFEVYADKNNIDIGDDFVLEYKYLDIMTQTEKTEKVTYKVTGFIMLPEQAMPIINFNTPFFQSSSQTAVLMSDDGYNSLEIDEMMRYTVIFNDGFNKETAQSILNNEIEFTNSNISSDVWSEGGIMMGFHKDGNPTISTVYTEAKSNAIFAIAVTALIAGLSIIVIAMLLKKRIENDSKQLGVMKSLGYTNSEITRGYMAFPISATVVGGLIGYILGLPVAWLLSKFYVNHYIIPMGGIQLDFMQFVQGVIVPAIALNLVSFIVIFILLRTRAIDLLHPSNKLDVKNKFPQPKNNKPLTVVFFWITIVPRIAWFVVVEIYNVFKSIVLKIAGKFGFITKFKFSLAFRSPAKLIGLFGIIFVASFFTYFALTSSSLFSNLLDDAFDSMDYEYMYFYDVGQSEGFDPTNERKDMINMYNADYVNKNGDKIDLVDGEQPKFTITGMSDKATIVRLKDEKGNDITNLINDGIVITKQTSVIEGLDVGDNLTLVFERIKLDSNGSTNKVCSNEELAPGDEGCILVDETEMHEVTLPITGISAEFMSAGLYYDIGKLNELNNRDKDLYTVVYSLDKPAEDPNISLVFSIEDLKANLENLVSMQRNSMYVLVAISAFLSLIIISVMTNFTIEENFRNISLLKVMGYEKKEVSKMVLKVFGPVVLFAAIIAYPVVISILKLMFLLLAETMGVVIPVSFNLIDWAIGTGAVFIAYLISLQISKRGLKKISLQEALKED